MQGIMKSLATARVEPYREHWLRQGGHEPSAAAVGALYVWQVAMASAWYEVLSFTEVIVRNAVDDALRKWNENKEGNSSWLISPSQDIRRVLEPRAGKGPLPGVWRAARRAYAARESSDPDFGLHPRRGAPVGHDDLVAQLTWGNLVHLLPMDPPTPESRAHRLGSGLTRYEHLWIEATQLAFPFADQVVRSRQWRALSEARPYRVPQAVESGYVIAEALERLRRLRNRVGHHEQMLRVNHSARHRDALYLVRAVSVDAAEQLRELSRVLGLSAMQPRP